MAASSRLRSGAIALVGILAAAFALTTLTRDGADAATARYRPPKTDQARLILRLHDLPAGFLNLELREERGGKPICSRLTHSSDTPPRLAKFVLAFHPRGCFAGYSRLFTVPGEEPAPALVGTGVMALGSDAAADAGWAVLPTLLGQLFHKGELHEVRTDLEVGTATRLFHVKKLPYPYARVGRNVTFLAWRSADTLAAVMTTGLPFADLDRFAAEFAERQQAHIDKPTRYRQAERFDGEVGLDDPAIDLPVYWLGRNFRPGHELPPNRLFQSGFLSEPIPEEDLRFGSEGPEAALQVDYANIWLDTWTPATWDVFANSKTGRVLTTWKCTQTRTVTVPGGSATIFSGYDENFRRCPKRDPDVFDAWVEIGGVTVVVNAPPTPDFIERVNPYGSFKGMEAIVRALKLRPPPAY